MASQHGAGNVPASGLQLNQAATLANDRCQIEVSEEMLILLRAVNTKLANEQTQEGASNLLVDDNPRDVDYWTFSNNTCGAQDSISMSASLKIQLIIVD